MVSLRSTVFSLRSLWFHRKLVNITFFPGTDRCPGRGPGHSGFLCRQARKCWPNCSVPGWKRRISGQCSCSVAPTDHKPAGKQRSVNAGAEHLHFAINSAYCIFCYSLYNETKELISWSPPSCWSARNSWKLQNRSPKLEKSLGLLLSSEPAVPLSTAIFSQGSLQY